MNDSFTSRQHVNPFVEFSIANVESNKNKKFGGTSLSADVGSTATNNETIVLIIIILTPPPAPRLAIGSYYDGSTATSYTTNTAIRPATFKVL